MKKAIIDPSKISRDLLEKAFKEIESKKKAKGA